MANLKIVDSAVGPAEVRGRSSRRTFMRSELSKERQKRGGMRFLERMAADVTSRRAMSQVCALRQTSRSRATLDRMVDRMRPQTAPNGPVIVTHDRRLLYEGHDRKQAWLPLECC
mmetsp:Transcript_80149/g.249763  ORF Transcript_80149/g.249763 Transcript_80149/m.249763 type:complete len:115 (+) Transcript_80149:124-468(+)